MYINKNSPVPVYYQLKNIILQKIYSGEFSANNPIPSERELSEQLSISRMTVRQALNQLVSEGVLYREKGRGTFVSESKIYQRNISSFSETVKGKGMIPSTRILNFEKTDAPQEVVLSLGIEANEPVYKIKRLRLADDVPIAIEEAFIPWKYCTGLEKYDLTTSLYNLLRDEYAYSIKYVDNMFEAVSASKEDRALLGIGNSIPILGVTGVLFANNDLKLLYEKSLYRSDKYVYNVRIFM